MIREDLRSRRLAVVPDFIVNPSSALYGPHRIEAPTHFVSAVMAHGWRHQDATACRQRFDMRRPDRDLRRRHRRLPEERLCHYHHLR